MKASTTLQVLLHGREVALLRAAPAMELRYVPEIVQALGVGAPCLSAALPVADKPYRDTTWSPTSAKCC